MAGPQCSRTRPGYFRVARFAGFFGFAFAVFIGSPQHTGPQSGQSHASLTTSARPHDPHSYLSPFFMVFLLTSLRRLPP